MIEVNLWGPAQADAYAADVYQLYDAVFGDQPDPSDWRTNMYDRHRAREGFRLSVAHDDGGLVGFAWGYVGERGQYWSDLVVSALPSRVADRWVGGHFEFVELAVLACHRRRGIGVRLHDRLLEGVTPDRALLGTDSSDSSAVRLYLSRGWTKLGELNPQTRVMGLHLSR